MNEDLWRRISSLKGKTLTTVRGYPFELAQVSTTNVLILVGPQHRTRHLDRSMLEDADVLPRVHGVLRPSAVRAAGISEYDPAYVAGIINHV